MNRKRRYTSVAFPGHHATNWLDLLPPVHILRDKYGEQAPG